MPGRIVDAVSFLRSVASGERPVIGRRVAVYGGGNTAMDAARVARRLGADEALIVYRRTREQMPAHVEEAEDAEREGVRINWLRTITAFDGPELQVELMELDESGYPQPTGRFETLAADTVILALGQETDTAFLRAVPGVEFERDGTVQVSTSLKTGCPGVFAGGDMVPSERTVTVGVGPRQEGRAPHRRLAARRRGRERAPKHDAGDASTSCTSGTSATPPAGSSPSSRRRSGSRTSSEVVGGLSAEEARYEAGRCLSCGNCFECDGCLGACPEDAVIKLGAGHRYRFDYDRCTGCGACFEQCPVHAIEMVPEPELMRATVDGNEAAASVAYRLQRGLLHLPDHAVVADGRAGRRVGEPGAAQRLGHRARGGRDAERGRRGRRAARRAAERGAGDDVHRLAGPAADDPEHVQDRRRADRRRCCTSPPARSRRRGCRSSATTPT